MTTTFISTLIVGPGPLHAFTDDGDELIILETGALLSTAGSPISGTDFSNLDVIVHGEVFSPAFLTWNGQNVVFNVGQSGTVSSRVVGTSSSFLYFAGTGCEIINDGTILASRSVGLISAGGNALSNFGMLRAQTGIYLGAGLSEADILVNGGLVHANGIGSTATFTPYNHAVKVASGGCLITNLASGLLIASGESGSGIILLATAGGATIRNFGSIESMGDFGVNLTLVSLGQTTSTLFNRGQISGGEGSFAGSVNADAVVNRGVMVGNVLTNAGDDTLDNRRGSIDGEVRLGAGNDVLNNRNGLVDGKIFGEDGNDRLIASALEDDIFDGGTGQDTIDYRFGPAVVVALDASFDNAGGAINDEIIGVEILFGSRSGADNLRGNNASNQIRGEGGADTLDGAGGADNLIGGGGADSLIGGLGNDSFTYQGLNQFGDVIADFMATSVNNDRFQFYAAGIGGGLAVGVLGLSRFQSRGDNAAQDADDQFIFRATDETLWFDVDGTGAEAPVMVADLQAGAIVMAADILLY